MGARKKAFVLIPFEYPYTSYYTDIIKPALEETYEVSIANEKYYTESIVDIIKKAISESEFVLAELSEGNPNVFYEVGLAHARGKPTILVARKGEKIPFDVSQYQVIIYDPDSSEDWKANLGKDIKEAALAITDTQAFLRYLGLSDSRPVFFITHCEKHENERKLLAQGLFPPSTKLMNYIAKELRLRRPESRAVDEPCLNKIDWSIINGAKTIFVFDSPQVNPYAEYIMNNRRFHLARTEIIHEIEERSGKKIQTIKIKNDIHNRPYRTDKYDENQQMSFFGNFKDYLVVMRMPGSLIPEYDKISGNIEDEGIVWLVYGITFKGSHAGAHLFHQRNFKNFETYIRTEKGIPMPNFFEALFEIPNSPEEVESFEHFRCIHFQEIYKEEDSIIIRPPLSVKQAFAKQNEEMSLPASGISIESVHLDPVAACNFKCDICIERCLRSKNIYLTTQKVLDILLDLHEIGCRDVRFYGGEPTLHPDFGHIIRTASSLFEKITVITNGSLLNKPSISESFKRAKKNLDVRVSLDANTQKTHQLHHNTKFDFEKLREGITDLIKDGVAVSISYLLTKKSTDEFAEACRFWKGERAKYFHPRIPVGINGKWQTPQYYLTSKRGDIKKIIDEYNRDGKWIDVPDWFMTWISNGSQPNTTNDFDRCYSGYYRFGISPHPNPDDELIENDIPNFGKIRATSKAWISMCLYYRYDPKFGCEYPDDLEKWCQEGRVKSLESIIPRSGMCHGTLCSRWKVNQEVQGS